MKKARRTTKGKCATYSSLTFESHELFRLCSIATVIFFCLRSRALSALLQNLADSRSHRDHRGFLSFVSVSVSIAMDDHAKTITIVRFRFLRTASLNVGKMHLLHASALEMLTSHILQKKILKETHAIIL